MKKVLFYAICLLALAGCKEEPKAPVVQTVVVEGNDSLQSIIDQRDKELNDMLSVFNEIQEGFREINEAEKRVTLAKGGEGTDRATRIKNDMLFIKNTMKKNKDLINKLQNQLSESDSRGEELKRTMQATIDALVSQMEGAKADPRNFLLMHAMGPNVAGVIGSAVAAGILLSFLG